MIEKHLLRVRHAVDLKVRVQSPFNDMYDQSHHRTTLKLRQSITVASSTWPFPIFFDPVKDALPHE